MIDWAELNVDMMSTVMPLTPADADLIREHRVDFRVISPLGDYARRPTRLLGYFGEVTVGWRAGPIHGPWRPTATWALRAAFLHWKRVIRA